MATVIIASKTTAERPRTSSSSSTTQTSSAPAAHKSLNTLVAQLKAFNRQIIILDRDRMLIEEVSRRPPAVYRTKTECQADIAGNERLEEEVPLAPPPTPKIQRLPTPDLEPLEGAFLCDC